MLMTLQIGLGKTILDLASGTGAISLAAAR